MRRKNGQRPGRHRLAHHAHHDSRAVFRRFRRKRIFADQFLEETGGMNDGVDPPSEPPLKGVFQPSFQGARVGRVAFKNRVARGDDRARILQIEALKACATRKI